MKYLKFILMIGALLTTNQVIRAQCQGTDPNWMWYTGEDINGDPTWDITAFQANFSTDFECGDEIQGSGLTQLRAPWQNTTNTDIRDIIDAKDYRVEDGWVLVAKEFGCPGSTVPWGMPYFILYNKYRGVVRVFAYNCQSAYTKGTMILEQRDAHAQGTTSIFTFSGKSARANDKYPDFKEDVSVSLFDQWPQDDWFVIDVPVAFDPETQSSEEDLQFEIRGIEQGIIDAFLQAINGSENEKIQPNPNNSNLKDLIENGQKVLKKIPKKDDIKGIFSFVQTIAENRSTANSNRLGAKKLSDNLKKFLGEKGSLEKVYKGIDAVSSALGAFGGVLNFFTGKASSSTSTSPNNKILSLLEDGNIVLQGTLTTQVDEASAIYQLPGSILQGAQNRTYLSCPLGVLNLRKTPVLHKKAFDVKVGKFDNGGGLLVASEDPEHNVEYMSLQVASDLEIDFNLASGLELVSIKAAVIGRNIEEKFPVEDKYVELVPNSIGQMVPNLQENPHANRIAEGKLVIHSYETHNDPNNTASNFTVTAYGTPFFDAKCLKDIVMRTDARAKVTIKVVFELLPTGAGPNETPIMMVMEYEPDIIDDPSGSSGTQPFSSLQEVPYNKIISGPITVSDDHEVFNDLETQGDVTISGGTQVDPIEFTAGNSIKLTDGFQTSSGSFFQAEIIPIDISSCSGVIIQEHDICPSGYSTAKKEWEVITSLEAESIEVNAALYPNPFKSTMNMRLELSSPSLISAILFDQNGREVMQLITERQLSEGVHIIPASRDIFLLPSGIYTCQLLLGSEIKSIKLIKQ